MKSSLAELNGTTVFDISSPPLHTIIVVSYLLCIDVNVLLFLNNLIQ